GMFESGDIFLPRHGDVYRRRRKTARLLGKRTKDAPREECRKQDEGAADRKTRAQSARLPRWRQALQCITLQKIGRPDVHASQVRCESEIAAKSGRPLTPDRCSSGLPSHGNGKKRASGPPLR